MQQNHTQAQQKKPLSSTGNGDLCLSKLKALLLQFLLYKNGAMGIEKHSWDETQEPSAQQQGFWQAPHGGLLSPH